MMSSLGTSAKKISADSWGNKAHRFDAAAMGAKELVMGYFPG
jgi:hypothetical protein